MDIKPFKAYELTTKNGVVIYTIVLPMSYSFTKFGKNDIIGKTPVHHLEDSLSNVKEVLPSDEVFYEFFPVIVKDIFENSKYIQTHKLRLA